jgi:hypothetical protein
MKSSKLEAQPQREEVIIFTLPSSFELQGRYQSRRDES